MVNYAAIDFGSNSTRILIASVENKIIEKKLKTHIVTRMAEGLLTSNSISSDGELAKIIIKAENGINKLSSDERLRFHFWMLVAVRRFESIYIQALYGSIEQKRIEGFERSIISLLANVGFEWWKSTKTAFSKEFISYADKRISSGDFDSAIHPGIQK